MFNSDFQMTVQNPIPNLLLRPITTGANSLMNQSKSVAITCNLVKAREKCREQGGIPFCFAFYWLKN